MCVHAACRVAYSSHQSRVIFRQRFYQCADMCNQVGGMLILAGTGQWQRVRLAQKSAVACVPVFPAWQLAHTPNRRWVINCPWLFEGTGVHSISSGTPLLSELAGGHDSRSAGSWWSAAFVCMQHDEEHTAHIRAVPFCARGFTNVLKCAIK